MQKGVYRLFVLIIVFLLTIVQTQGQSKHDVLIDFHTTHGHHITVLQLYNEKGLQFILRSKKGKSFIFPKQINPNKNWSKFNYGYYFRPGGVENDGLDLNSLSFKMDDKIYVIYENYVAVGNEKEFGFKILNAKEVTLANYKGKFNTLKGSIIDLRYIDEIPKGNGYYE
jgi:hypothetical protein